MSCPTPFSFLVWYFLCEVIYIIFALWIYLDWALYEEYLNIPTPARPCEEVHSRTSLMSSSLILQLCLVGLIWIVLEMGGRWLCSYCFVGCGFEDLFNIARSILEQLPSSFFSLRLVSVHVVHPYSSMHTTSACKKLHFILSDMSDFYMSDNLSRAVHAFAGPVLMLFSVDDIYEDH